MFVVGDRKGRTVTIVVEMDGKVYQVKFKFKKIIWKQDDHLTLKSKY